MNLTIEDCSKLSFFELADTLGGPNPLKRTLSLMRFLEAQTVAHQILDYASECNPQNKCDGYHSCESYIKILPSYKLQPLSKTCHKIAFFSLEYDESLTINDLKNKHMLGYCKVHIDRLQREDGTEYETSYLTESIIRASFRIGGYFFGQQDNCIDIGGRQFKIRGNYFSQQNHITNCCAHAAIKMAVKTYKPEITADFINDTIGIDHEKSFGNKGLRPNQICTAIEDLSGYKTFFLSANSLETPADFMKAIYLAIESKLPVILLVTTPPEPLDDPENRTFSGHAVSLIGHTFKEHNWWAYGLKGYFDRSKNVLEPLSSFLWCDNFIVQDDNLGPFYHLSSRFLTDAVGLSHIISAMENAMMTRFPVSLKDPWLDDPVSAVIVYPPEAPFPKQFLIEPWAFDALVALVNDLSENKLLPSDKTFDLFFLRYFNVAKNGNGENGLKEDSEDIEDDAFITNLIFRTLVVRKSDYIKSLKNDIYNHKNEAIVLGLNKFLPEFFWMTEISIPELFWTNKAKIGEIITHPYKYEKIVSEEVIDCFLGGKLTDIESAVIFIRLPHVCGFFEDGEIVTSEIEQSDAHHDLIETPGLFR